MSIPCNEEGRSAKSWVECPEDSGKTARQTVVCNVDELASAIALAMSASNEDFGGFSANYVYNEPQSTGGEAA